MDFPGKGIVMRKTTLLLLIVLFFSLNIQGDEITSLSQIFLSGKGIQDRDKDHFPDEVSLCLVLPDEPQPAQQALASDIAARANLESLVTHFSLVKKESEISEKAQISNPILIGSELQWVQKLADSGEINLSPINKNQGLVTLFSDNHQKGIAVVAGSPRALLRTGRAFFLRWPYFWEIWGRKEGETYMTLEKDLTRFLKKAGISPVHPIIKEAFYEFPPLKSPHESIQRLDFERGEIKNQTVEINFSNPAQKQKALQALQKLKHQHRKGKNTHILSYSGCGQITLELKTDSQTDTISLPRVGFPERFLTPSYKSPRRRKIKGKNFHLLNFFSKEGLYSDSNEDKIPDGLDGSIIIPENGNCPSLSHLSSRLVLHTAGASFPVVCLDKEIEKPESLVSPILIGRSNKLNKQLIKSGKLSVPSLSQGRGMVQVVTEAFNGSNALSIMETDSKSLRKTLHYMGQTFPYLHKFEKGNPRFEDVSEALNEFLEGKRGCAEAYFQHRLGQMIPEFQENQFQSFKIQLYLPQENENFKKKIKESLESSLQTQKTKVEIFPLKESKTLWEKEKQFSWEGKEALDLIKEKLKRIPNSSGPLNISIGVSEDPSMRKGLQKKIENFLLSQNIPFQEVEVLCSYKQGFFWLTEKILPLIKKEKVHHLTIRFSRVKPEFNRLNRFYTPPARWLQELYPVDEMIARETSLPLERIEFEMKPESKPIYEVWGYDGDNNLCLQRQFSPRLRENFYLKELPEWGKVQTTTGWVKIQGPKNTVLDISLKTDLEKFWEYYQNSIIPEIHSYILKKTGKEPTFKKQPYFKRLLVEMWFSEPDYPLGLDQEIISSLESIHDEVYFDTLDFLRGITQIDTEDEKIPEDSSRYSAPGKILPLIHSSTPGKPGKVKITFEDWQARSPQMILEWKKKDGKKESEKILFPKLQPKNIRFNGFIYDAGQEEIEELLIDAPMEKKKHYMDLIDCLHSYRNLCQKKVIPSYFRFPGLQSLALDLQFEDLEKKEILPVIRVDSPEESPKNPPSEKWTVSTQKIISPSLCLDIVQKLSHSQELQSYIAGKSYENRKIPVLEAFTPLHPYTSLPRLITFKPTLYISGRQHANEVCSTNYILKLAELVTKDEKHRNYIQKVNLVLHPMENPDGAELAYRLQKITPLHSLHAGRYSSLGIDVGQQVYSADPLLPEAKVRRILYDQWLPDIYLNLHGYPSHEWVQQFSGYSPYLFHSYWIPRGWFAYYRGLNLSIYEKWKRATHQIREFIIKELNSSERIRNSNQKFYNRYYRWAARWQPHLARLELYEGVNLYAKRKSSRARRLSSRRKMTYVEETPEFMDETAQGTWLDFLCEQGLAYLRSHLQYLSQTQFETARVEEEIRDRIRIQFIRSRPGEIK